MLIFISYCFIIVVYGIIMSVLEQEVTFGANCPPGLFPEKCSCIHYNCAGARFDGDTCVTTNGEVSWSSYIQ